jgi:hypothetical protein
MYVLLRSPVITSKKVVTLPSPGTLIASGMAVSVTAFNSLIGIVSNLLSRRVCDVMYIVVIPKKVNVNVYGGCGRVFTSHVMESQSLEIEHTSDGYAHGIGGGGVGGGEVGGGGGG